MVNQNMDAQQPTSESDWQAMKDAEEQRLNGLIETQFDKDTLEHLTSSSDQIAEAFKLGLLQIENNPGATDEFLTLARDFSNALFARINSANLMPGSVVNALEDATDLMAPETPWDKSPRATNALKALNDSHRIAYSK